MTKKGNHHFKNILIVAKIFYFGPWYELRVAFIFYCHHSRILACLFGSIIYPSEFSFHHDNRYKSSFQVVILLRLASPSTFIIDNIINFPKSHSDQDLQSSVGYAEIAWGNGRFRIFHYRGWTSSAGYSLLTFNILLIHLQITFP